MCSVKFSSILDMKKPVLINVCLSSFESTVQSVFLKSPTLKHIRIFCFYMCVKLQLKCVGNESNIFFSEKVLAV